MKSNHRKDPEEVYFGTDVFTENFGYLVYFACRVNTYLSDIQYEETLSANTFLCRIFML